MKNTKLNINTIVSVTPIAVVADSRTYKIAASFKRFGFTSIVVEGEKSNVDPASLPFELLDVKGGVIFSKPVTTNERREKPKQSVLEFVRYWMMRLFKPFLNQYRTYRTLPRASVYYLHSYYLFPAVYLKCLFNKSIYIYDAHDFYPVVNPGKFNVWMERQCVRLAVKVVTVSNGVAVLLEKEYGCSPVAIRNSHDIRLERKPVKDLRRFLELTDDKFLIVIVGQAKDGMAVIEVLKALKELPISVHLAFLGKNTNDYLKFVEQFNLESRVHLVPPVMPDQVVPFIQSADIAMVVYRPHSSNYEYCLPNGFFQSISAQLPLVYSDLPELRHIADKYSIGVSIDPQSSREVRDGILQLLQSMDLRQRYKRNLEIARRELSWEREEEILHSLLSKALKAKTS